MLAAHDQGASAKVIEGEAMPTALAPSTKRKARRAQDVVPDATT